MRDWSIPLSGEEITEAIKGKTVVKCEVSHWSLIFRFSDGTSLCIEYDWIYEWELEDSLRGEKESNVSLDNHTR